MTSDGKKGFTSKAYKQGNRDKYWFAYRRNPLEDLKKCEEVYVVYGCKDESTMVSLPVSLIEEHIDILNISKDDDSMAYGVFQGCVCKYDMALIET